MKGLLALGWRNTVGVRVANQCRERPCGGGGECCWRCTVQSIPGWWLHTAWMSSWVKVESSLDKHPIFLWKKKGISRTTKFPWELLFWFICNLSFLTPCRYVFVLSFPNAVIGCVIGVVSGGIEYQQCVRYQHSLLDRTKVIFSVCIELFRLFIFNYNIIILIMYLIFCL